MTRFTFTLIFFLSSGLYIYGQQDYIQYFENDSAVSNKIFIDNMNPNNVWMVGEPQKTIFDSASTAPNALLTDTLNSYPTNDSSDFLLFINTGGGLVSYYVESIRWKQKIDFEAGKDGGYIQFRTYADTTSFVGWQNSYWQNIDTTWQNIFDSPEILALSGFDSTNLDTLKNGEIGFTGTDSTWREVVINFNNYALGFTDRSFELRYVLCTDSAQTNQEGWMIDDLVIETTNTSSTKKLEIGNNITVYPNPSTGIIHIENLEKNLHNPIEMIQLFNSEGRLIQYYQENSIQSSIDLSDLPKGAYYLKVQTTKQTAIKKLILN